MTRMKLEELSPELFIYELYDSSGPLLDPNDVARMAVGYCDASRLQVRPRKGLLALMCEDPDGNRFWFHASQREIDRINKGRE